MEAPRSSVGDPWGWEAPLRAFYYNRILLLLAWIPCAVGVAFGAELAFLRVVFPRTGPRLLVYAGWLFLAAGLLGFALSVGALLRRRPFLLLTARGIGANVLPGRGYLWIPWEVVLDVQGTVRRTGPADTGESPLMAQASQESLLALRLSEAFPLPRFLLQASEPEEGWLGLQIGMLEVSAGEIVGEVRRVWQERRGQPPEGPAGKAAILDSPRPEP